MSINNANNPVNANAPKINGVYIVIIIPPKSIVAAHTPIIIANSLAFFAASFIPFVAKFNAPIVKNMNAPKVTENANAPRTNGAYNVIIVPPNSIIPPDIRRSLPNSSTFNLASFITLVAKFNAPIVKNINALRATVNPSISNKCVDTNPPNNAPSNNIPEAATITIVRDFKLFTTSSFIGSISFNLPTIFESIDISLSIANAPI